MLAFLNMSTEDTVLAFKGLLKINVVSATLLVTTLVIAVRYIRGPWRKFPPYGLVSCRCVL
jgi:hypothetical protein